MTPCPVRSSVSGALCILEEGHAQASPERFHRYAPAAAQWWVDYLTHRGRWNTHGLMRRRAVRRWWRIEELLDERRWRG